MIGIIGARTGDLLILEEEMRAVTSELIVTTDDGSKGRHGLVTDALKDIIEAGTVDRVIAIGPTIMMKFVAKTTEPHGIKTIVSLNPIMIDGTRHVWRMSGKYREKKQSLPVFTDPNLTDTR